MNGNYKFEQDNLYLQLKNMPKPPISKELAKEFGFDTKKFDATIDKLLYQISEVRKERMKENYIFEEKMKIMENNMNPNGQKKNRNNIMKNKAKANTKNNKINVNRPKSNYKSIKSSGYGIAPKKINIFSSRGRKKTKDNIKFNNIPAPKAVNKKNNNIPNNQNYHSLNIKNVKNNTNNNNLLSNKIKINNGKNEKLENEKINNDINIINPNKFTFKDIVDEIDKIKKENQLIEEKYKNIPDNSINPLININNTINNKSLNINKKISEENNLNILNNNKHIYYKNNSELIMKNYEFISQNIINDLLNELIIDLKNIEEAKYNKEKNEKQNNDNKMVKENKIKNENKKNLKFKVELNKEFIERCNKNKDNFKKYMKLKGSFFTNNIFEIYDSFIEEMSKEIVEQGLDYYIKQMDDFIKIMEKNK